MLSLIELNKLHIGLNLYRTDISIAPITHSDNNMKDWADSFLQLHKEQTCDYTAKYNQYYIDNQTPSVIDSPVQTAKDTTAGMPVSVKKVTQYGPAILSILERYRKQ